MKTTKKFGHFSTLILGFCLTHLTGCKEPIAVPPMITTSATTALTMTTAASGGKITSEGGAAVSARGVCWSTSTAPTTGDHKTLDGTGSGTFNSGVVDLNENTTYYLRAYASNSAGTSYGTEVNFTTYGLADVEGNGYHYVEIGTQTWMKENLKTTKYRDGSEVPLVTDATAWSNLSTGAYCINTSDTSSFKTYGLLYNWYAVVDNKELCPTGWHSPADDEWDLLATALGGSDVAGGKMKSTGTLQGNDGLWYSPNQGATNESGFTGLPGGFISDTNGNTPFFCGGVHSYGMWWSTLGGPSYAYYRQLQDANAMLQSLENYSRNGKSVRCVKD